ncbi:MAG: CBS domain-containing protein [Planctomycetaceae bacterium]|nr:CBS domain-containing protein [Planctomycetaceae bacterium]
MIEEFQDPLANYDPKGYCDPVERSLAEELVLTIQHRPYTTISPETPVRDAIKTLSALDISYLMIEAGGSLVGVFSEREALLKIGTNIDTLGDSPVSEFMTANPIYVHDSSASASALCVMAVSGCRHVPIVDLDARIQGIVSPQRVTEFLTNQLSLN